MTIGRFAGWTLMLCLLATCGVAADGTAEREGAPEPQRAACHDVLADFMARHEIPGAAVAITNQGRLAYAAGFGWADPQQREAVAPASLFRIASLSKPITAVAVVQLAERGRLSLDARVLDILGAQPYVRDATPVDQRLGTVTVRQLLQHRGGWDRDASFDPMFQSVRFAEQLQVPPPAAADDIIRIMLGRALDFAPGQRYAYSNFGYCLLGRVIETVTGLPYERYVQQEVLAPLGIRAMRLGRTRLERRFAPDEVQYHDPQQGPSVFAGDLGQPVPRPYGTFYLEAMDAHGGWLASAVDLARFAVAFDDPERCPILSRASLEQLHARPAESPGGEGDAPPVYYSLGWQNRVLADENRVNRWHNGSLPGTTAILIRRHDGRNMVALLNTRVSPHSKNLQLELDRVLHRATDAIQPWPEGDLFSAAIPR